MKVNRQALALVTVIILATPETALTQQGVPDAAQQATEDNESQQAEAAAAEPVINPVAKYAVPIADIVAFDYLLNRYGWYFIDRGTYRVDSSSVRRNLNSRWVLDNDPFSTNQFLHPYQGSVYHGFARAAGHDFWPSFGYTFGGSLLWELAGETTTPSKNDQIASGIGGNFLGEPLFRLANLVLERANGTPGFWRQLAATTISPATGFNRLAYGDRFRAVFPSGDPDFSSRLQIGVTGTASALKGLTQALARTEAVADFSIDYGLPGDSTYAHRRPFDYFNLQLISSSANHVESIFSRGLLAGKDYGDGADRHKGVWGLYGTYDYVSPQLFRVSSTAFSLGNTSQRRLFTASALQSTVMAGVGYGAGGTINGAGERDYHYGLTPQALVAMRLVAGDRVALEVTVRDYYISNVASTEHRGAENIARAEAEFGLRVFGHHAASVKYLWSRRAASYPDLGNRIQSRESFGLFYTYLGGLRYGLAGNRSER